MFKEPAMFQNREAAGRALARSLRDSSYAKEDPLIVAIPHGGVPLGKIVADELNCELDICLVRRIVSQTDPGFSIAAVTENGDIHLSNQASWGMSRKYIEEMRMKELADIRLRRLLYNTPAISVKRRTVILVDDGIASGATMSAAIHTLRKQGCAKLIVAAPICSFEAYEKLRRNNTKLHDLIVLHIPPSFKCLAQFYMEFSPITDLRVMECLRENRAQIRAKVNRNLSLIRDRNSSIGGCSSEGSSETEEKDEDLLLDDCGVQFSVLDLATGRKRRSTPRAVKPSLPFSIQSLGDGESDAPAVLEPVKIS
jgi:predicted phosphoribosyltransferase